MIAFTVDTENRSDDDDDDDAVGDVLYSKPTIVISKGSLAMMVLGKVIASVLFILFHDDDTDDEVPVTPFTTRLHCGGCDKDDNVKPFIVNIIVDEGDNNSLNAS